MSSWSFADLANHCRPRGTLPGYHTICLQSKARGAVVNSCRCGVHVDLSNVRLSFSFMTGTVDQILVEKSAAFPFTTEEEDDEARRHLLLALAHRAFAHPPKVSFRHR